MITFDDVLAGFNAIFGFFGQHISTMLLIGGFFAGFYFIYRFFKGKPVEGEPERLLKWMSYLGAFVGVLLIGGGVNAWYGDFRAFTCILAIVVGIGLILRPIKDVPWAAIVGVIAGSVVVFLCASYLEFFTDAIASLFGINPYWVLIALFIIILLMCYLAFKLIEDIGKILAKILSSRPTSAAIMVICVIEAILVYMGTSLWTVIGL